MGVCARESECLPVSVRLVHRRYTKVPMSYKECEREWCWLSMRAYVLMCQLCV